MNALENVCGKEWTFAPELLKVQCDGFSYAGLMNDAIKLEKYRTEHDHL